MRETRSRCREGWSERLTNGRFLHIVRPHVPQCDIQQG
jgi:hypothetical protein